MTFVMCSSAGAPRSRARGRAPTMPAARQRKPRPRARLHRDPARREHAQHVTVGERERVAAGGPQTGKRTIGARPHVGGLLPAGAAVAPQVPVRVALADLGRRQPLVVAVVPLPQVLAELGLRRRTRPARRSPARAAAGCAARARTSGPRAATPGPWPARARLRSAADRCGWCAGRPGSTRSRRGGR